MSDRDKKLLVYLGALLILAAAYFLVGRPYLEKIDQLSTEKGQLESQLAEKRKALENKDMYEQGITDSEARIQEIIDEFPEDNSDEKSIMFVAHAEPETGDEAADAELPLSLRYRYGSTRLSSPKKLR